jgi:hypothetical protein
MSLYHFTDIRNLGSIKKYGLHSWWRLYGKKIDFIPASNECSRRIDRQKGLHNYIRLCRRAYHPMAMAAKYEGRIGNFTWIKVDEDVVRWRQTKFSNKNATSNDAEIGDYQNIFWNSDDDQAEVMVYGSLNTNWIRFP